MGQSRAWSPRRRRADKAVKIYDHANHDLLHEPGGRGEEVEGDILAWLDAHEGGKPVAPAPPGPETLAGHPRGWTQAVELAGGVGANSTGPANTGFAGRVVAELARPAPFGYHGELLVSQIAGLTTVALQPLGVAVQDHGIVAGIAGGGSLVYVDSAQLAASGSVWLEVPLGPIHLGALTEIEHSFGSGIDNATYFTASGSLRLGRDHRYWPGARAGVGPVVTAGTLTTATPGITTDAWFVMVGVELYGAD